MDCTKNILLVDDEEMIRDAVSSYLKKQGFFVYTSDTGTQAMEIFETHKISFVILDLMLPDLSGEELCAKIRKISKVPILMLTAKTTEEDLLNGLQIGADDYMTKPFSLKELYARIEVILRRVQDEPQPQGEILRWNNGELEADFEKKLVKRQGVPVSLTPIEWKIIAALMKHPQKVFSRDELLALAFDDTFDGYDRVIDTHIKNLRKKIECCPKQPVYIRTVHGFGYMFGGAEH